MFTTLPQHPHALPAKDDLEYTEHKTNGAKKDGECCVDVGVTGNAGGVGTGSCVEGSTEHFGVRNIQRIRGERVCS
jgi:hypothetical protein